MNSLRTILIKLLLVPFFLSGCQFYTAPLPLTNYYYLNPNKDLSAVGKVAIVELDNESSYPQISTDLTKALFQSIQKKQVFSLTVIHQNDPAWHSLQLDLSSTYTLEQLSEIKRALKCDAILIGTVTRYQPYPHMVVGLRLKLIDLMDGELIWAVEQVWDGADKTTEYRTKSFFQNEIRSGYEPLREQLVIISPLKFIKFVAYEVAETIKPKDGCQIYISFLKKRR
ncbi:MAG: hypothetical protein ACYS0I_00275 [Planctomycetota bacterium]|jgi:hypothetical protein